MDQLSIPEVIPRTPRTPLQLLTQMLHPTFPKILLLHQNQSQLIVWMPYFKCKELTLFCKSISRRLLNGKAPHHEFDTFTHVKGLLYKHIMVAGKKFLALVIPKSWKYTVLVEAHDKLGHQGNSHTYCLIKCQYYCKGMNKDIQKYIANCVFCRQAKAKVQQFPLQMTEIPDRPFDKIAIDLVTDCNTSTSGNKHILTIIDHLTG